jgi:ubiquinone/menaquinone biosynthesis C-methylase UbiE
MLATIAAWIYDLLFYRLSSHWYIAVLNRLSNGAKLLDVGVGTGSSLIANAGLLKEKDIHVHGVDINQAYLKFCQKKIDRNQLNDYISIQEISFYDVPVTTKYDAVYFSASFMLLPDQNAALEVAKKILNENGMICFTQTFSKEKSIFWEIIKPILWVFTSVHFGKVTYEKDFIELMTQHDLEIVHNELLSTQGLRKQREMKLMIAKPKASAST